MSSDYTALSILDESILKLVAGDFEKVIQALAKKRVDEIMAVSCVIPTVHCAIIVVSCAILTVHYEIIAVSCAIPTVHYAITATSCVITTVYYAIFPI